MTPVPMRVMGRTNTRPQLVACSRRERWWCNRLTLFPIILQVYLLLRVLAILCASYSVYLGFWVLGIFWLRYFGYLAFRIRVILDTCSFAYLIFWDLIFWHLGFAVADDGDDRKRSSPSLWYSGNIGEISDVFLTGPLRGSRGGGYMSYLH